MRVKFINLRTRIPVFSFLLAMVFLSSSCVPKKAGELRDPNANLLMYPEPPAIEMPEVPAELEVVKTVSVEGGDTVVVTPTPVLFTYPGPSAGLPINSVVPVADHTAGRLIIKNAEVRLQVEDTNVAIDRLTQVVEDVNGYMISSRTWYKEQHENNYLFATMTIAVPVDEFERTLRRIREIGLRVLDELASGQDVTDQYVDLNSQLENLQVTRDRIRTFLDQAQTAEEALLVNQQLTQVEAEIAQIQGRMNYLFDRSAYSTITINLEPELPELTPTTTPTPWNPGITVAQASQTLVDTTRYLVDLVIWFVIVVFPLIIVPVLLIFLGFRVLRRKHKSLGESSAKGNQAQG